MFKSAGNDNAIDVLIEKAMNERDDLVGYMSIRHELEKAIKKWR